MKDPRLIQIRKDAICTGLIYFLGVFILIFVRDISTGTGKLKPKINSRFFPVVLAIIFFILATCLLYRTVRRYLEIKKTGLTQGTQGVNGQAPDSVDYDSHFLWDTRADVVTMILLVIYVLSISKLGYLLSTAIYLPIQMYVLSTKKNRNIPMMVIIGIVAAVIIYFVFSKRFALPLPKGFIKI